MEGCFLCVRMAIFKEQSKHAAVFDEGFDGGVYRYE